MTKRSVSKGILDLLKLARKRLFLWPPKGFVRFGDLRRVEPIGERFGVDRGVCIDRYYIENFLSSYTSDIRGHVLEIGTDLYPRHFGGDRVTEADVLDLCDGNPKATIVADLSRASNIPSETFHCIIFTQTLQFIYDVHSAIKHLYRILRPDGVLLATFPGISQISRYDMDRWGDYWRFTSLSAARLFGEVFNPESVEIRTYGNVLSTIAFLHGLAVDELTREELDYNDPDYELIIGLRATK